MRSRLKFALLVAVVLTAALTAFATPVAAGGRPITLIDQVVASQFDTGVFVALVAASGPADIIDAQIAVNGVAVVPDKVESYATDGPRNATLFKIVKYGTVAAPGSTLTAIVTDTGGSSATDTAVCGRGILFLHIASACR